MVADIITLHKEDFTPEALEKGVWDSMVEASRKRGLTVELNCIEIVYSDMFASVR